eukprot:7230530-Alexandrium_andersonii.AAC.1
MGSLNIGNGASSSCMQGRGDHFQGPPASPRGRATQEEPTNTKQKEQGQQPPKLAWYGSLVWQNKQRSLGGVWGWPDGNP